MKKRKKSRSKRSGKFRILITEVVGWVTAIEMAHNFRKEWEWKKNAKDAAQAYAEAAYYKQYYPADENESDADDFSGK